MKKRVVSLLLTLVMLFSLVPTSVWAADTYTVTPDIVTSAVRRGAKNTGRSVDAYFEGLPVSANPGTGTTAWKVGTKDGGEVLMSGNKAKSNSTSTLTLTFTEDTHLTFEYKVSSEAKYDKCNITLGTTSLVQDASGDQDWTGLELDARQGDVLTVTYKKDSSGDKLDDCVYLRNFSAGEALVVTFHANNGTDDTATQKVFGGKGTLKANTFTCAGKIFAGWATSADGDVVYQDGAAVTVDADLKLYAVWSDAYTVTFTNGDSSDTVMVPQNGAIGSRIPADLTKKGYTFEGWFNGEEKLTAETIISGDVTYTAKWAPITYTIAFSANGGEGTAMANISATYDEDVTLPENTYSRPGYAFNGWGSYASSTSGSAAGSTVKNLTAKQGDTVTLYAAWMGRQVNVTLHLNYEGAEDITRAGIVGSNYNYIYTDKGGSFSSIKDPVRTGYIFDGWFDAAEGGSKVVLSYKFTAVDAEEGFRMYAHWTKGVTVHFDGNGYKSTIADKTVTPDKVGASLPSLWNSYYPVDKALDGWYIKNADGSFGEAVTKDTAASVFEGMDEVTLIAKWRDYQYIIKYNVKYADKSFVTGTMADQAAPFDTDVTLTPCGFSREGYTFAGWSESSYSGSPIKYADGATINRAWEEDDWGDGSEDNESYNLYANWTESKSPEQQEADKKLDAAETAISGTYNVTYGKDTNALTMVQAKLTAAGITDVTVAVKAGDSSNSSNYAGVADDGTIRFKWNENGSTPAANGNVRPKLVLTYKTYTKESTECLFSIPLDEVKAMAALNAVAERITVPTTVESASDLTSLPQYPLKAGVDASKVDYNSSTDLELWSTASWTSSHPAVIAVTAVSYPYFAPYKATVSLPEKDTAVTLTMTLVYSGREDLKINKVYTVQVKGTKQVTEVDYNELLNKAFEEIGLKNFNNSTAAIDTANVISDIQFPTTKQLSVIALREYGQGFDGKYTPILLESCDADVVVSADPATANVARMITYRPLPGEDAKNVTVTMKILDRPSGEGSDYASMKVLGSKSVTLTVQPLTQDELDNAAAFMKRVCTEDVYWQGIRKANSDKSNVKFDMQSFIEIVPDGDGYKFIRNMDDYNFTGVKADDIDGWYDAQKYRCFRSSDPSVVAHENLLLTQPEYNTDVTIDSVLTYTEYAKYYEKFQNDEAYAQFAKFYKQPISVTVKVIGTTGVEDPNKQPFDVTVNVEGHTFNEQFTDLSDTFTSRPGEHKTAADALLDVLAKANYTYTGTTGYITGITDANSVTMASGDKTYGSWSGWMFTVNGEMPIKGEDPEIGTLYATLDEYQIKKDDVIRMYYVACIATADGHHAVGTDGKVATCTEQAVCGTCGDSFGALDPDNHTGKLAWVTTADTHKQQYTCCEAVKVGEAAHEWDNGVCTVCAYACLHADKEAPVKENVVAATCTTDGTHDEVVYCATCGKELSREPAVDKATGHTEGAAVKENEVKATCTTDGTHDEVVYCTVCKAELSRTTVTDSKAAGHKWDDGVVTTQPTVSSEGVKTFTCTVCKATKTESIAKLPAEEQNDQTAADAVIAAINKIGSVTEESGDAIKAARKAYDSLTDAQKALVPHDEFIKLTTAEVVYASLLKRNDPKSTSTGSTGSDSTKKDDSKTVKSSQTGDMGIAIYAAMSLLSVTGGAWIVSKKRKDR